MPDGFMGIPVRYCSCGLAMLFHAHVSGKSAYSCEHCDAPCNGVAGPGRCEACDRMKVKR